MTIGRGAQAARSAAAHSSALATRAPVAGPLALWLSRPLGHWANKTDGQTDGAHAGGLAVAAN